MTVIFYDTTFYCTLTDASEEQALVDTLFPNIYGRQHGMQVSCSMGAAGVWFFRGFIFTTPAFVQRVDVLRRKHGVAGGAFGVNVQCICVGCCGRCPALALPLSCSCSAEFLMISLASVPSPRRALRAPTRAAVRQVRAYDHPKFRKLSVWEANDKFPDASLDALTPAPGRVCANSHFLASLRVDRFQ